ncbi:MAG: nucleotidyl transferase AbiEii/AbiGii toxin family protein [Rhodobacteraceae bacterium]|nr:nucleotidyl transferase AbiEii/AbiGii toxin family protein [Paracoccaceae bacterium]
MAFKGGTSLTKILGAINRFSEDVDVTLDYR